MHERGTPREGNPGPPRKIYPDFIGNNPFARRFFDIGVDAMANLHVDVGETLEEDKMARYTYRLNVASSMLIQHDKTDNLDIRSLVSSFREEAKNRNQISPLNTYFGINPFAASEDDLGMIKRAQIAANENNFSAERDQIIAEIHVPRYPDVIGDDEEGKELFDNAVLVSAAWGVDRENEQRHLDALMKIVTQLDSRYPDVPDKAEGEDAGSFWLEQALYESLARGKFTAGEMIDVIVEGAGKELDEELGDGNAQKPRSRKGFGFFRKRKD